MYKKSIYPKTKRFSNSTTVTVTEKLDGSNLGIFKLNDEIYIATRNNIIKAFEEDSNYKGLDSWLKSHHDYLKQHLCEKSIVFGEWIGMGKIKYSEEELPLKFYMFAKANIDENFDITNLEYTHNYFQYCFSREIPHIPHFIGTVPIITILHHYPTTKELDELYEEYRDFGNVEGFVIIRNNEIKKYVRYKNGVVTPHIE